MQQKSLGLIEIQGLAAGIEAADAAVKSANVELVGYELTKGGGWTTIKILGDVGAVKAAVDAARIAAGKVSRVVSTRVIARPSMGLTGLIHNTDTVGDQPPEPPTPPTPTDPPEPTKPPADAQSVEESAPEAMESPEEAQPAEEGASEAMESPEEAQPVKEGASEAMESPEEAQPVKEGASEAMESPEEAQPVKEGASEAMESPKEAPSEKGKETPSKRRGKKSAKR
ncbi:BMC domain-containing protein [Intestinimonas butyriciproducens]|uniref:BMC domain-containing protein n=1 Tax=Intestinimonas butyriciproducens TaxID=1297617 RepID=UPI00232FB56B|nr:BMC domain-containing protein [Intestinimonas butyriciproducens]MDB7843337.1 BMC domain-containing protein [Intestinimonas butyriciproducens]MDB7856915.1 BMC domain-containing protein [Intestinimonas butyriciproducens]